MICWSCERNAGAGPICGFCGAIQPPDPADDHFRVLDLEHRYDQDLGALEARYKDLTRKLHPDRFVRADPRARRASLQRSVQLNEAWRTLKDPIRRAEYMLSQDGIEVGSEEGTVKREAGGGRRRMEVPQDLLTEILELRSELGEARLEGDDAKVGRMAEDMRKRVARSLAAVAAGLAQGGDREAVARELVALRYYRRFLDEVAAHEEAGSPLPSFGEKTGT